MTSPYTSPLPSWPGATHLTVATSSRHLDLDVSIGQRLGTFRFDVSNGVTGVLGGQVHPIIAPGVLSHDTSRTTKRQLQVRFGVADTSAINPLTDRIAVSFVQGGGTTWPLGRYMFTDEVATVSTGGSRSTDTLLDEMFLIDQQISDGFPVTPGRTVQQCVIDLLAGLPLLGIVVEPSPFLQSGSWAPGATRGQILNALATQGDYQTPWLDNHGIFRMIRTVDPADSVPTLDMDRGNRVIRDSPTTSSDLLSAPNRFIVIGNAGGSQQPIVGKYDLPPAAVNSIQNRGFVVPAVVNLQVVDSEQAAAAARSIGIRASITTQTQLSTAPDPRHDGYDVVRWRGTNWLETGWSMTLKEGAPMSHTLRMVAQ